MAKRIKETGAKPIGNTAKPAAKRNNREAALTNKVRKLYESGASIVSVSEKLGISTYQVSLIMDKNDIAKRRPGNRRRKLPERELRRAWKQKQTVKHIMATFGVSHNTAAQAVDALGLRDP